MTDATNPTVGGESPTDEPTFDPDRCQWCGETGFDLRGLAHHVWMRCEVVERLANENIEDCRLSHERFFTKATGADK
jgi:hypothetical protein